MELPLKVSLLCLSSLLLHDLSLPVLQELALGLDGVLLEDSLDVQSLVACVGQSAHRLLDNEPT